MNCPEYVILETESEKFSICTSCNEVEKNDLKIQLISNQETQSLDVCLTSADSAVKFITLRWNCDIPEGFLFLSDAWERGYGDLEWRGMVPRRFMPWYFLMNKEQETIGYGVKVRPSAMCFWQIDSAGITLHLDVRCGAKGVQLKGRTLTVATIVSRQYKDISSYQAAVDFCKVMCTDPIFPKFPVYGSNNWYYAYGLSSEKEILEDTDYLVELTKGIENRPYMVIDDCWQEHHRINEYNGGPWREGNKKFPDMQRLAAQLKEKNVHPGIWVRFLLNEDNKIPKEWRLSHNNCLDPSHPDAIHYIKEDVKRICNWGFTLIKHDFSTFDIFGKWGFEMKPFPATGEWHFWDRTKTSAEIIVNFYHEILESAKATDTIILGCNTIGHLGAGLMHMNRTGDDTSGLDWEVTRKMGINTLAFQMPQHKTFFDVDADCVGITGQISWEYNYQWAYLLGNSGTPLFVSAKPGVLSEQENEQLHQIFINASKQEEIAEPLDWMYTTCPEKWKIDNKTEKFHWYQNTGISYKI